MSYVKAFYTGKGYSLFMPDGTPVPGCLGTTISDEWVDSSSKCGPTDPMKTGRVTAVQEMYVEVVNEEPNRQIFSINNSPDPAEDIVSLHHVRNTKENPWMMSNHDPSKWIMRFDENQNIKVNPNYPQVGKTSDGYHTFDELYEHRIELYITLLRLQAKRAQVGDSLPWMSKAHSDGSVFEGWFILGIFTDPGQQITYHLPMSKWDECIGFAIALQRAPEWDGHTSADVLKRLAEL